MIDRNLPRWDLSLQLAKRAVVKEVFGLPLADAKVRLAVDSPCRLLVNDCRPLASVSHRDERLTVRQEDPCRRPRSAPSGAVSPFQDQRLRGARYMESPEFADR